MTRMPFKQFTVILFFTAPMWILFAEALFLFIVRIGKYQISFEFNLIVYLADCDILPARKLFDDLALVQLVLLIPQPIYYIAGESIKIGGPYADLYYPNKWEFVASLSLIIVLYAPSFALVFFNRRMVNACIRQIYPNYDFNNHCLYVKRPLSPTDNEKVSPEHEQRSLLKNNVASP